MARRENVALRASTALALTAAAPRNCGHLEKVLRGALRMP